MRRSTPSGLIEFPYQPALLDEETIIGYLQRLALIGASGAMKPVVQASLPIMVQPPWLLPSCLRHLGERIPVLPPAEDLLRLHTIFPSATSFLPPSTRTLIAARMCEGQSAQGLYFMLGLGHSQHQEDRAVQAFCYECLRVDVSTHGFGYWHRGHQFPYIHQCPIHRAPLSTPAGCCAAATQVSGIARLPGAICSCKANVRPVHEASLPRASLAVDFAVGQIVFQLLNQPLEGCEPRVLGSVYRRRFGDLGFARGLYMDATAATAWFRKRATGQLLEVYRSSVESDKNWFRAVLRGTPPASFIRNGLLIAAMFDSLQEFRTVYDAARRSPPADLPKRRSRQHHAPEASGPRIVRRKSSYRKALLDWLRASSDPTRVRAYSELGYTPMWLYRYDRAWFDRVLPRQKEDRRAHGNAARWQKAKVRSDEAGLRFVKRRYEQLTAPGREPVRITRKRLVSGLAGEQTPRAKTDKLVSSLVESPTKFRERMAIWIVERNGGSSSEAAIRAAQSRTRLGVRRIHELF
jgi:hypothetical protein